MLPLSLGRPSLGEPLAPPREPFAWLRPANIADATSAERRALGKWLAVFVTLGVIIGLGHVWLRLMVVDVGYRLSATRQVIERLQQEGHELTLEVASLGAPGRIQQVAQTRLGMVRPERGVEAVLP